jgi:hypothetical protein
MRRRRLRVRFAAVALLAVIPLVISGALRYRASQADQRDLAQQQSAVAALYLVAASAVEPARGDISAFDQPIQTLGADVNAFWETRRADLTDPARAAGTVVELAELIGARTQLGSGSDAAQLHLGDLVSRHHPRLVTSIARVEAAPTDSDAVRASVAALRSLAAAPGSAQAAEPDVWANELLDRATRLEQRLTNRWPSQCGHGCRVVARGSGRT